MASLQRVRPLIGEGSGRVASSQRCGPSLPNVSGFAATTLPALSRPAGMVTKDQTLAKAEVIERHTRKSIANQQALFERYGRQRGCVAPQLLAGSGG